MSSVTGDLLQRIVEPVMVREGPGREAVAATRAVIRHRLRDRYADLSRVEIRRMDADGVEE